MDPLHAKAISDLKDQNVATSQEDFYSRHSCTWLHKLRRARKAVLKPLFHVRRKNLDRHRLVKLTET